MNQAKNEEELAALPMWVVVRTASKQVRERGIGGQWYAMGVSWPGHKVTWEDEDFPVTVLWSYAQEVEPPARPLPPYRDGGGIITTTSPTQQGSGAWG